MKRKEKRRRDYNLAWESFWTRRAEWPSSNHWDWMKPISDNQWKEDELFNTKDSFFTNRANQIEGPRDTHQGRKPGYNIEASKQWELILYCRKEHKERGLRNSIFPGRATHSSGIGRMMVTGSVPASRKQFQNEINEKIIDQAHLHTAWPMELSSFQHLLWKRSLYLLRFYDSALGARRGSMLCLFFRLEAGMELLIGEPFRQLARIWPKSDRQAKRTLPSWSMNCSGSSDSLPLPHLHWTAKARDLPNSYNEYLIK